MDRTSQNYSHLQKQNADVIYISNNKISKYTQLEMTKDEAKVEADCSLSYADQKSAQKVMSTTIKRKKRKIWLVLLQKVKEILTLAAYSKTKLN